MLQARQPVLRKFYYPVMPVAHLQYGLKPFTLFGEPIVVWLDEQDRPAAAVDRCCHRTALRLMENSFDNAHIAFVHHNTFGENTNPIPADLRIVEYEQGLD